MLPDFRPTRKPDRTSHAKFLWSGKGERYNSPHSLESQACDVEVVATSGNR